MSAARKPHGPGRQAVLRAFPDRAQRLHYALANNQADAVSVWRDAAIRLLDGRLMAPHNPGYLLGCLLLLDGVATDFDLRAAWGALADAWRDTAGSTGIEWHDADGRLQRRHLSVVTQLSWAQQRGAASYDAAAEALAGVLAEPAATDGQAGDGPLHHLIENVQAALVLMVSGDLAGHAIGRQPLTAVSRACLVRRDSQLALLPASRPAVEEAPFADDSDDMLPVVDPLDFGLHDAVLAHAEAGSLPQAPIVGIRAACTMDTNELPGPAQQRASMLRRLRALAPACEAAGGWTAFLLLVVVTLVKVGTRETRPLAASSIWAYVPLLLDALAPRLGQFSIAEVASIDWSAEMYEPALADPSVPAGQRGKLSAALAAFHDTLCSVLGAAPLERRLTADTGGPVRCAEVVWPHEVLAPTEI